MFGPCDGLINFLLSEILIFSIDWIHLIKCYIFPLYWLSFKIENFQIVEFISVLVLVGSEAAEKELIQQGAIDRILQLFFE